MWNVFYSNNALKLTITTQRDRVPYRKLCTQEEESRFKPQNDSNMQKLAKKKAAKRNVKEDQLKYGKKNKTCQNLGGHG